jgi:hypothetical protein
MTGATHGLSCPDVPGRFARLCCARTSFRMCVPTHPCGPRVSCSATCSWYLHKCCNSGAKWRIIRSYNNPGFCLRHRPGCHSQRCTVETCQGRRVVRYLFTESGMTAWVECPGLHSVCVRRSAKLRQVVSCPVRLTCRHIYDSRTSLQSSCSRAPCRNYVCNVGRCYPLLLYR